MGLLGPEQQLTLYQVGGPEQLSREYLSPLLGLLGAGLGTDSLATVRVDELLAAFDASFCSADGVKEQSAHLKGRHLS